MNLETTPLIGQVEWLSQNPNGLVQSRVENQVSQPSTVDFPTHHINPPCTLWSWDNSHCSPGRREQQLTPHPWEFSWSYLWCGTAMDGFPGKNIMNKDPLVPAYKRY